MIYTRYFQYGEYLTKYKQQCMTTQCNRCSVNSFAEYDIYIYSVCNAWTQAVVDAHKITKHAFEKICCVKEQV
jgi:hypothetical protein